MTFAIARHLFRAGCFASAVIAGVFFVSGASAGISVSTLSVENSAQPGDAYTETIALANSDTVTKYARVYQSDYSFASDGSNHFDDPGTLARSNAHWISFSPRRVELPPESKLDVAFEVRVPDDTLLSGTYWSMLMIEEDMPAGSKPLPPLGANQTSVRQLVRYGVQCVTNIRGSSEPQLQFTNTRLVLGADSSKQLEVDVQNSGERWAVPTAFLELYNADGRRIGRFDGERKRIFPGTSVRFRISIGDTAAGKYKGLVILDNGDQNVLGAKYDLEF